MYDATPVITSVIPAAVAPGASSAITISGTNFGPQLGSLEFCVHGASPCDGTAAIQYSICAGCWMDQQIIVTITTAPNASGPYDVQVVSAGEFPASLGGTGFVPEPGGQSSSQSNRGTLSAPNIVVSSNGTPISPGATVTIGATPTMPSISATAASGASPGDTVIFSLGATTPYGSQDNYGYPVGPQSPQAANQYTFAVPTSPFYGGQISINWIYDGVNQSPFTFNIAGTNPLTSAVQTFITSSGGPWFTQNIGNHESGLAQFVSSGTNTGLPMHDSANGYGIMQLTNPAPTEDQKWNWQSNITAAIQQLGSSSAYTFWRNQVSQWIQYNTNSAGQQVPPPNDQPESQYCTFTLSPNSQGTGTVPYTGSNANTYWFGDALLMKQYAGVGSTGLNYLTWQNNPNVLAPNQIPYWSELQANFSGSNGAADIVYQFCTCLPGASCQHTG